MEEMNQEAKSGSNKNSTKLVVVVLVIVVLVLAGVLLYPMIKDKWDAKKAEKETIYHAVFLSNGQVYFGQLAAKETKKSYVVLTDVYYLQLKQQQAQQQVQPAEGGEQQTQTAEEKTPEFTLVKLGQELHGPEDKMTINSEQVLFYETLKSDSNVMKAIKDNKEKEEKDEEKEEEDK